jgi:hypothetical protein
MAHHTLDGFARLVQMVSVAKQFGIDHERNAQPVLRLRVSIVG